MGRRQERRPSCWIESARKNASFPDVKKHFLFLLKIHHKVVVEVVALEKILIWRIIQRLIRLYHSDHPFILNPGARISPKPRYCASPARSSCTGMDRKKRFSLCCFRRVCISAFSYYHLLRRFLIAPHECFLEQA